MKIKEEYKNTIIHFGSPFSISINTNDIDDHKLFQKNYPWLYQVDKIKEIKK